jgi:hypothetical protein
MKVFLAYLIIVIVSPFYILWMLVGLGWCYMIVPILALDVPWLFPASLLYLLVGYVSHYFLGIHTKEALRAVIQDRTLRDWEQEKRWRK